MRTTNERMAELNRRVKHNELQRLFWRKTICSFTICLMLIAGLSHAMPNITGRLSDKSYSYTGLAASVFTDDAVFGFFMIGVLAFALGVCVTVLCYKLRNRNVEDRENGHD